MVAKNIWFIVRVFHNGLKTLKKQDHFNNLGGLDEYSTQKKIKWNDWKKIQGHKRSFSQRINVTVSPGDDENKKDHE